MSENFNNFRESLDGTDGTAVIGATFILAYTLRCSVRLPDNVGTACGAGKKSVRSTCSSQSVRPRPISTRIESEPKPSVETVSPLDILMSKLGSGNGVMSKKIPLSMWNGTRNLSFEVALPGT